MLAKTYALGSENILKVEVKLYKRKHYDLLNADENEWV